MAFFLDFVAIFLKKSRWEKMVLVKAFGGTCKNGVIESVFFGSVSRKN